MRPRASRSLLALTLLLDALPGQWTQATLTDDQRAVFALIDPFETSTPVTGQ